jgi:acetyl esterase/lipase
MRFWPVPALLLIQFCAAVAAAPPYDLRTDVVYSSPGGQDLLADVYLPASTGKRPAVLVLHSGSWQRGSKRRMTAVSEELARYGFVVVNANYRLAPASQFPAQLIDVRSAISWIRSNSRELGVDPGRIGVLGYSAGGHLALLSALSQNGPKDTASVQAVVSAGGPTDLTDFLDIFPLHRFLGKTRAEDPELYKQASPIEYASAAAPPTLLIHGESDLIVPRSQSEKLLERLKSLGAQVEFRWLPAGHVGTTAGFNAVEVQTAAEFLGRRLGLSTASR